MTREDYIRVTGPFREDPNKAKRLALANKAATLFVFFSYPLILLWLLSMRSASLYRAIVVPLDGFLAVSVFRWLVNRKRPYEAFDIPPVLAKDTKGKSFPSRHVFSAMVIAVTVLTLTGFALWGMLLVLAAAFLGWIRVVAGVHYPIDVISGMLLGAAVGMIGLLL